MSESKCVIGFLSMVLCAMNISAQNYVINAASNGSTINTCSGTIYDSDGLRGFHLCLCAI